MPQREQRAPDRILAAAFDVFSNQSLAEASMASIADRAGMSRPALYQYFDDKTDIYRSMLEQLLAHSAARAVDALDHGTDHIEALVGFMDASWGDRKLWRLSRHQGNDLAAAKAGMAKPVVDDHYHRLVTALRDHLAAAAAPSAEQLDGWVELVRYAPLGFTYDQPTLAAYRRRLRALSTTLAEAVTAEADPRSGRGKRTGDGSSAPAKRR